MEGEIRRQSENRKILEWNTSDQSAAKNRPTNHFRFLDLPLELRLEIYGHYLFNPWPIPAGDFVESHHEPFNEANNLKRLCRKVCADISGNEYTLLSRENVCAIHPRAGALTLFIDSTSEPLRRPIRHLRMLDLHIMFWQMSPYHPRVFPLWLPMGWKSSLAEWKSRTHKGFDDRLQLKNRNHYVEVIPTATDLVRLSPQTLPNLKTLALDIGRIDAFNPPANELWLEEAQHIRDTRYRNVLETINTVLPHELPKGLSITIRSRMDPVDFTDEIGESNVQWRPILHITLTYTARGNDAVYVNEVLPAWRTAQDRRGQGIKVLKFPSMEVKRYMPRSAGGAARKTLGTVFSQGYKPIPGFHMV